MERVSNQVSPDRAAGLRQLAEVTTSMIELFHVERERARRELERLERHDAILDVVLPFAPFLAVLFVLVLVGLAGCGSVTTAEPLTVADGAAGRRRPGGRARRRRRERHRRLERHRRRRRRRGLLELGGQLRGRRRGRRRRGRRRASRCRRRLPWPLRPAAVRPRREGWRQVLRVLLHRLYRREDRDRRRLVRQQQRRLRPELRRLRALDRRAGDRVGVVRAV